MQNGFTDAGTTLRKPAPFPTLSLWSPDKDEAAWLSSPNLPHQQHFPLPSTCQYAAQILQALHHQNPVSDITAKLTSVFSFFLLHLPHDRLQSSGHLTTRTETQVTKQQGKVAQNKSILKHKGDSSFHRCHVSTISLSLYLPLFHALKTQKVPQ